LPAGNFAWTRRSIAPPRKRTTLNRSIANLLESRGALSGDPADAVDFYTRQSALAVTARDIARMGATLALGGVTQ
jgi:glutaminase